MESPHKDLLAGMDRESEKRDLSIFKSNHTKRQESKQDQFPQHKLVNWQLPLMQFTQNIMATSVVTVRTKNQNHTD